MSINFIPRPRTVLICDYTTGFVVPEMVKRRPVVVLSPVRHLHPGRLILIVPVSTGRPKIVESFHVHIRAGKYPFLTWRADSWVKCDAIAAVALTRLSLPYIPRSQPQSTLLSRSDFRTVQNAVLNALGL